MPPRSWGWQAGCSVFLPGWNISGRTFLQALGRYLDVKAAEGSSLDDGFCYARQVLLHYARWMLENEYPYLEKPEILEFPNETWAAQDLRKSDIIALASYYAQKAADQHKFEEKAHFFFNHAVNELDSHDTKTFNRPMALLVTNGMSYLEMTHHNAFCQRQEKKPYEQNRRIVFNVPAVLFFNAISRHESADLAAGLRTGCFCGTRNLRARSQVPVLSVTSLQDIMDQVCGLM
ncbi:MAG: hypothetical protein LC657_01925 [Desulfobacteraceae bacterium]|nr:hypothetical protein [Desulfobacteraceae bacterium]